MLAAGGLIVAACSGASAARTEQVPIGYPEADTDAILQMAREDTVQPDGQAGHVHATTDAEELSADEQLLLTEQLSLAVGAIDSMDTVGEVEAVGYVQSSAPIPGIGAHWTEWSQVVQPFDPAQPSMLLFDVRVSPARLVGYSYAIASETMPEGFAGPSDHWHRHRGLCIDATTGWLIREGMSGPEGCEGTYVAGGEMRMLHAWVVPDYESRDGVFAVINSKLCPSNVGTPDIIRCPDK